MVTYFQEIRSTFRTMFAVLGQVLPQNRRFVDDYIDYTWRAVMIMTSSLEDQRDSLDLEDCMPHFEEHIEAEKKSLEEDLERTGYHIPDDATVRVILDGPIEQVR